jgi:hypothetical protein
MSVHAFTSFSYSYLNRARVWARTLRRYHSDWILWAVITDLEPEGYLFDIQREPFDKVITVDELFGKDFDSWLFNHDVVEACTGVKGRALQYILSQPNVRKVLYFDPDTAIFNSMEPIIEKLDHYSIVLTPHQIDPEPYEERHSIIDNEMASLQYGVFNLGFIAVSNDAEAHRFASWWSDRLQDWCHDRLDIGVFVDQKWCNLVPCFFDRVLILRDPGCNVASWNLSQRVLELDEKGTLFVNGSPLKFFHFTKLGVIGDTMTKRYAKDNIEVYEVWSAYRRWIIEQTDTRIPNGYWGYGQYTDGTKVPKNARLIYRESKELRSRFPHPFLIGNGFKDWYLKNHSDS